MSDDTLLRDAADRIFADHTDKAVLDAAERGEFAVALWRAIEANGFHQLAMTGGGVPLGAAFSVIGLAGRYALPVPFAEIVLGHRWAGGDGTVGGLVSVGRFVDGRIVDVPWGRAAAAVIGVDPQVGRSVQVALNAPGASVVEGRNLAGEPRDAVTVPAAADWRPLAEPAFEYLALARAVATAGCLGRILELCLDYAGERKQFGRPIARFQAIQHNLAVMAGEVAAATRAADAAVDALDTPRFALEVAAAKARVGEAAGVVAEVAHQVHGAMGYTHEHQLHHFTRRVWAWRDEYGNETVWQQRLGSHLASLGADRVWDFLATRG